MAYTEDNYLYVELDIGDWDMDANQTLNVAHSLSATEWKTIRELHVVVRNDADTAYYNLYTQVASLNIIRWDSTNVKLIRDNSGEFDNTSFDSTSYNRGWIIFKYIPD